MINANSGFSATPNSSPTPSTVTTPPAPTAAPMAAPPSVSAPMTPKKKGFNWKMFGGIFVAVLVVAALGVGLYLQGQSQDVRQQAAGSCSGASNCSTTCPDGTSFSDACPAGGAFGSCAQWAAEACASHQGGGGGGGSSCSGASNCSTTCSDGATFSDACPAGGAFGSCGQWATQACSSHGGVAGSGGGGGNPNVCNGANTASSCVGNAPGSACNGFPGICTANGTDSSGKTQCGCIPTTALPDGSSCTANSNCQSNNCQANVCRPIPQASAVPTLPSCTATCSGSAVCNCPSNCVSTGTVTAGSTCGGIKPTVSPSPSMVCNNNSDTQCIGRAPGLSCTIGGTAGTCTGVGGGPCSCSSGGTGGQTACSTFTSSTACGAVGYCVWLAYNSTCVQNNSARSCTYQGTTYSHGTRFCATTAVGQTVMQCNNSLVSSVVACANNEVCLNGQCIRNTASPSPSASTGPIVIASPTPPTGGGGGNLCPNANPDGSRSPAVKWVKFVCNKCQRDPDGEYRCYEGRVDSNSPLSLAPGECGQVDVLSGASDSSYCGFTDYTCDQPQCQGGPPSSPTPPSSPPPSAAGPMCLNITMAKVNNLNQPTLQDAQAPVLGDTVRFTCGQVAGISNYTFRVIEPDGTLVPLQATGNVSATYTINKFGQFRAQCQICTSASPSSCQPFAQVSNN